LHDQDGLLGVRPGADLQIHVGFGHLQLIEEHLRHAGVVMLAGVHPICSNSAGRCAISRMMGAIFMKLGRAPTQRPIALFNGTLTTLTGADHLIILFCVHLRHQRPNQWHADSADGR